MPKIFERVAKNGLRVYLCEVAFQRSKFDKTRAREASLISFVPAGVAAVGMLQAKGFGYMKIG